MSVINLGRTTKTNIAYYHSDGMGRDGYITYNDGGFWKDKYIKSKNIYHQKRLGIFRSLLHQAAPFHYYSDGSGRDSYILENYAGLVKSFEPLAKQNLAKILRKDNDTLFLNKRKFYLTNKQRKYLKKLKKIQDGVISRLYNDSLEKIKKNNLECRANSLKEIFIDNKNKIRPISQMMTPKNTCNNLSLSINYLNSQNSQNNDQSGNKSTNRDRFISPKNKTFYGRKFLDKYFKNNDKKIKVIKNLKINSCGLKSDFISDETKKENETNNINEYNGINSFNSFNNLSPQYSNNKNFWFSCRNNIKRENKKDNNLCFSGNNTFGSFRVFSRNKSNKFFENQKFNNIKKRNNIKKFILDNSNRVFSESNKNNNK